MSEKGRTRKFFSLKSPRFYFQDVYKREIKSDVSLGKNLMKVIRGELSGGYDFGEHTDSHWS